MLKRVQICLFAAGLLAGVCRAEDVIVTGARVNLRAAAGMNSKIVSMATEGQRLKAKSITAEWVEIVPPAELEFWLHSDFVEGDRVVGAEVNVRSGPSIRDVTLARLPRGSTLTVRRHSGDWLLIAPPPGISLWIVRSLVRREGDAQIVRRAPPATPAATPATPVVKKPPPPKTTVVKPALAKPATTKPATTKPAVVRTTPAVAAPAVVTPSPTRVTRPVPAATRTPVHQAAPRRAPVIRDVPTVAAGAGTEYEGIVQKGARTLHTPAAFRLVRRLRGRSETICHLRGNNAALDQWVGRSVRVHGHASGLQGVREPVLDVTQLRAN